MPEDAANRVQRGMHRVEIRSDGEGRRTVPLRAWQRGDVDAGAVRRRRHLGALAAPVVLPPTILRCMNAGCRLIVSPKRGRRTEHALHMSQIALRRAP